MTVELDKLDMHYRQQLSALMDGELSPDQARFLLRRLQHDEELAGQWDRWQLGGEILRGRACAPAPEGFAARVAEVIAAEPPLASPATGHASRSRLLRWGGGALAASLAFVALFIAREQVPREETDPATPRIAAARSATDTTKQEEAGTLADAGDAVPATLASASVAVASVPRAEVRRGSATRTQQAARSARNPRPEMARAVAQASHPSSTPVSATAGHALPALNGDTASLATRDPFSRTPALSPQTRPWPRSVLSPYAGGTAAGSLTTGYSSDSGARTFYPFDPALPQPVPSGEPQR